MPNGAHLKSKTSKHLLIFDNYSHYQKNIEQIKLIFHPILLNVVAKCNLHILK
ncbi:hypothetical protein J579_3144 [Acinetobacter sp. 1239920]|nr:hypothetical protein J579_3144 [Acinetobacter sp. 1239920]